MICKICAEWAHQGNDLFLSHHRDCPNYNPEADIKKLLLDLISGIEAWAADEDGLHPEIEKAYVAACCTVGQFKKPKGGGG